MVGNMYEDVATYNPLAGWCKHNCTYCSTHTLRKRYKACDVKYRGDYRLVDLERNLDTLSKGRPIFVCAQNDLFEEHVPSKFIQAVLDKCREYPDIEFWFQSKNPRRMLGYIPHFPRISWLGTTVETDYAVDISNAPIPIRRLQAFGLLPHPRYITIEPIILFSPLFAGDIIRAEPDAVFIGADSKGNHLEEPASGLVFALIQHLRSHNINVILKSNLKRLIKDMVVWTPTKS